MERERLKTKASGSRQGKSQARQQVRPIVDAGPAETPTVKSAARALRVLELFDELRRDARVAEISMRLGYPQSSTSVLLKCLEKAGYLDYSIGDRSYYPSPRVALLGSWLDGGPIRSGALRSLLEEISQETQATVILAARSSIYSQYLHVIQARTAMRYHVPPGSKRLLTWSATGFVLLAQADEKEIRALCARTNSEVGDRQTRIKPNLVLENVESAKRQGHFFSRGLVTPGAGSIAISLPQGTEAAGRPLAVAVSGLLEDLTRRERQLIRQMSAAIARFMR